MKGCTEVQLGDISSSSFIHSITEGHQISQAQITLGEAILALSNHLPVFHTFQHICQEDLFHDLTRNGGKADSSVAPRVLFTLFKNECDVSFSSHC